VPRLLVVDDDPDLRSTLLSLLAEEGYTVEVAPDGREALERLSSGPHPDAILLDLMMPVMNGWQFRARQLALPAFASIPTIVMTAIHNLERAAITADHFLPKPIRLAELRSAIDRCLLGDDESPTDPFTTAPPEPLPLTPGGAAWHLVAPRKGESCRWEDSNGRWVSVAMGEDEELGMAVVRDWQGMRASFERYEDALRYCAALRE
jgi:CheY-like chemotaxis protein